MSAQPKPELVRPDPLAKVVLAAAERMEEQEREIASLKRQREAMGERIALIQAEKNELELRLSLQILKIHDGYLNRITALEHRCTAIEEHLNQIANHVQGLPTREEFKVLHDDFYAHSAGH